MADFSSMEYGYNSDNVATYLDAIKNTALQNAKDAILATDNIKTVCDDNWEGKAKENFKSNLDKDAQHVANQLDSLFNILNDEINSVQAAMANKDESLISAE